MAAVKAKIEASLLLLDDLQLDEEDASSDRYAALAGIKDEMTEAKELMECRLDLIEKADGSSAGWGAAAHYEKTNGLKLKSESSKLWVEAEKAARDNKKKQPTQPFRYSPTNVGKYQRSGQG